MIASLSWLPEPKRPAAEPPVEPGGLATGTSALARAVASIIAVAMQRAAEAGQLDAMRRALVEAVGAAGMETALAADGFEEPGDEVPPIADAGLEEAQRLTALLLRQAGRDQ